MAKNWDYAKLSTEVSEHGGVNAFKDKLYNNGYGEGKDAGISEGRAEVLTEMVVSLGITAVTVVGATLYDYNKDKIHGFANECKNKAVTRVQHCKHKIVNWFS